MAFRSSNPALKADLFKDITRDSQGGVMTLDGTINKVGLLLSIVIITAGTIMFAVPIQTAMSLTIVGSIGGFILALITMFSKENAKFTAPLYSLFEGMFLGGISLMYKTAYNGIVAQAVFLTFGIFISLLLAYKTKLIQPTEKFKLGIAAATGGIMILYLVNLVMSLFGHPIGLLSASSPMGIAISGFIVVIASLNLILDFDFIDQGCEAGAPKYMEWYGAFGLIVTLVWLYLEILSLLAKIAGNND